MKKAIMLAMSLAIVCGCAVLYPTWNKTSQDVVASAKVTEDTFKNTKWVTFQTITPQVLQDRKKVTGTWDTFSGKFLIRASVNPEDNTPKFFQIYISTSETEWGFYNRAIDKEGKELQFVPVDSNVTSYAGVRTNEQFALTFDKNYLESRKNDNLIIKVYGKKDNFVFYVPQTYLEGVYDYFYGKK